VIVAVVLYGMVSLSPTTAWAVGYGADLTPLTQRWNGSTWSIAPDPVHGLQILYAILPAGPCGRWATT
jgi:hypothetical protein